jgi:hypothetical protein
VLGDGVFLGAGGAMVNQVGGTITGVTAGVYVANGSATITNAGTIEGKSGIFVAAGDPAGNTLVNSGRIAGTGGTAVQFGAGNDVLTVNPGAVFAGAVKGGGGTNKVIEGAPGTLRLSGFSGFEIIVLANGGTDTLTLTTANFAGVAGKVITVDGGNAGNTLSEAGVSAADEAVLKGGAGADTLIAGRNAELKGGGGKDVFVFTTPGSTATPDQNTIADFTSGTDEIAFSEKGFALGTKPVAAVLFTSNPTGSFTNASQRFSYDTASGKLFYDAHGSASSSSLEIATLTTHPTLTAGDISFVA